MAEENDQRKHVLQQKLQIRGLHDRVETLGLQNKHYKQRTNEMDDLMKMEKEGLEQIIEKLTDELNKTKDDKIHYQIQLENQIQETVQLKNDFKKTKKDLIQSYEIQICELQSQIKDLQSKIDNIESFLQKKAELEQERENLKQQLEDEKKEKQRQLADKDRERVLETDNLNRRMLHQIQSAKQQLQALKSEQIDTTTKLTLLQNHQLTTELEYQSKQTEKLLFKNSKLQEQVTMLKRDIEIHKQVEQELAKRSHFCQKLIKKLTQKVKDIEEENSQFKSQEKIKQEKSKDQQGDQKTKDDIILFLEKNLDNQEKKMAKLQNDYDILKNENQYLLKQQDQEDRKPDTIDFSQLLADYLEAIKSNEDGLIDKVQQNEQLKKLQDKKIEEFDLSDKETVINMLIEHIRPYFKMKKQNQSLPLLNSMPSTSLKILDMNANLAQEHQINFPKLNENQSSMQINKQRFKGVPLEMSTKIVRSNKVIKK